MSQWHFWKRNGSGDPSCDGTVVVVGEGVRSGEGVYANESGDKDD